MSTTDRNLTAVERIPTILRSLSTYFRVVGLVWKASAPLTLLTALLMIVSGAVPVVVIYMTKVIIDAVVATIQEGGSWQVLFFPIGLLFTLWTLEAVAGLVAPLIQFMLHEKTYNVVATAMLTKVSRLDLAYFDSPELYDRIQRGFNQWGYVGTMIFSLISTLQALITTVGALVLISAILHPLAFVVLMIGVAPTLWLQKLIADREFTVERALTRTQRIWFYMQHILSARQYAKEIRVYGTGDFFLDRFRSARTSYMNTTFRLNVKFAKWTVGLGTVSNLGILAVYAFAALEALAKRVTIGDLAALFQAARTTSDQLQSLFRSTVQIYEFGLEATHFFDFMDEELPYINGALKEWEGEKTNEFPNPLVEGITFKDVSFSYPSSTREVLDNLSFTIPAGQKVAIVGENGAGKSTIIKLACRLYDPTDGEILVDNMDMRSIDLDSIPGNIGTIFQDYATFDLTVAENIGLGDVAQIDNTEKIKEAAKQGGAFNFISKLEKGFDTFLGREYEEGTDLSGGEWQRIAISRAAMADSAVLFLDEPTAALDAYQENELYQRIFEMTENRTVIFVSHRFSTVRMADIVLVLENGKIVESGSHEDLMHQDGSYKKMFSLQASRYN